MQHETNQVQSSDGSASKLKSFGKLMAANWKSALTVSLVSVPLSIAIAVASGASPLYGIITAVWGGLIAAIFGGSNFNIVGPAGALTAILAAAALQFGPGVLPSLAIISGILILAAWAFKLDRYISYIPASVIHGFTASVAIVLAAGQLNSAFGLTGLVKHPHFVENVAETFRNLDKANATTTGFFVLCIAFLYILMKLFRKVPGAVVLAPIAIVIGYLGKIGSIPMKLLTLGDVYPNLHLSIFSIQKMHFSNALILPALTIALVAILETNLSAKIADGMTGTKYNRKKETFGLGLANIFSGFFGGLPATGVFVRTSLNVRTHATHKTSQGMNAVFVAIIALLLLNAFQYIPMAAIAGILIFTAVRMIEIHHFKRIYSFDKTGFGIAIAVAAISVYQDALVGILVGTVASLVVLMERLSKGQFELYVNKDQKIVEHIMGNDFPKAGIPQDAHILVYSIKGHLTYTNGHNHIERFEKKLGGNNVIILRLRELAHMDIDGVDALEELIDIPTKKGQRVIITGITPLIASQLKRSKAFNKIAEKGDVFDRTHHALNALGYELGGSGTGMAAVAAAQNF